MKITQRVILRVEKTAAFVTSVHGCGLQHVDKPVYAGTSERGQAFRDLRVSLGISLRQAADALEVKLVPLSLAERGGADFEDWDAAEERLRSLARWHATVGTRGMGKNA